MVAVRGAGRYSVCHLPVNGHVLRIAVRRRRRPLPEPQDRKTSACGRRFVRRPSISWETARRSELEEIPPDHRGRPQPRERDRVRCADSLLAATPPSKETFPLPGDWDTASSCEPADTSGTKPIDRARARQAAMWREQRAMGVQWKITDLVTLGQPARTCAFSDGLR